MENTEMKAMKKEMRLIINTILINIRIILIFGLIGFFISLLSTLIPIDNKYKASSAIANTVFYDEWDNTGPRLIGSCQDLFDSTLIQDKIINIIGDSITRQELQSMTSMKTSASQTILTITAQHKDPSIAIKTANTIAYILIIETNKIYDAKNSIKVLDKATSANFAYKSIHIYVLICFFTTFLFDQEIRKLGRVINFL